MDELHLKALDMKEHALSLWRQPSLTFFERGESMASSYYKRTPYGWCLDHYYDNPYNAESWQAYVEKMEAYLNDLEVSYSVAHYKTIVRVHVYFSAIKKMGYRNAVNLYWMSASTKYTDEYKWTYRDVKRHVKEYFVENDLEIKEEENQNGRT